MKTIIEFFDPDAINNLIELLLLCPEQVVFIYDRETVSKSALENLERACRTVLPGLRFFSQPARFSSRNSLLSVCRRVAGEFPGACVDLTGGGELAAVCAYEVCLEEKLSLFQVELSTGAIVPIHGQPPVPVPDAPPLTLELLLAARGASAGGYIHALPDPERLPAYEMFCRSVFNDPKEWKALCRYLQAGCTQFKPLDDPLNFSAPETIKTPDGRTVEAGIALLETAQRAGMIEQLRYEYGTVSFRFPSASARKYMTDFGVWLEFFCYRELLREPRYTDVHMSLKVTWPDAPEQSSPVVNEIDVTYMCREKPFFLSCKLSEPGVEALYELSMYARYLGGVTSRCVLVVLEDVSPNSPLQARARQMGIQIISRRALLSGEFLNALPT